MGKNYFTISFYDFIMKMVANLTIYLSGHAVLREAERGQLESIKRLLTKAMMNPDTWDLLSEISTCKVDVRHYVRVESYRFPNTGIFLQNDEGGVVLVGNLQTRRFGDEVKVEGELKVVTYKNAQMLNESVRYHPDTLGLVYTSNATAVMRNHYGKLVEVE